MDANWDARRVAFGRLCIGSAIAAFGGAQVFAADFVTRMLPAWPVSLPGRPIAAVVLGAVLLAAGGAIVVGRRGARSGALAAALLIVASLVFFYLPQVAARPGFGGAWTNPFKYLAILGGTLLIAALARKPPGAIERPAAWARLLLGGFMVLGGIQHFVYAAFVVRLVPAWIPRPEFWAAFTGLALIAGGLGLQLSRTVRLAAWLSGAMIFTWFLILHLPRAAATGIPSEWSGVFESLAMSGIAFVLAGRAPTVVGPSSPR